MVSEYFDYMENVKNMAFVHYLILRVVPDPLLICMTMLK